MMITLAAFAWAAMVLLAVLHFRLVTDANRLRSDLDAAQAQAALWKWEWETKQRETDRWYRAAGVATDLAAERGTSFRVLSGPDDARSAFVEALAEELVVQETHVTLGRHLDGQALIVSGLPISYLLDQHKKIQTLTTEIRLTKRGVEIRNAEHGDRAEEGGLE